MPFGAKPTPVLLLSGAVAAFAAGPFEGAVLPLHQVEVSAPVGSRIAELKVKEGDAVVAGQPLAILYGRLEELEMQRAKAMLDRREFEAKGAKRLFEKGIIPESKALESRIELDLARFQYETAAEQVRLRTILAPMGGVVVAIAREVGETVATGQLMFRILDASSVVVQCLVDAEQLNGIEVGKKARVRVRTAAKVASHTGLVTLVDPFANAEGKIRVKVLLDNASGAIRPGVRATVDLEG